MGRRREGTATRNVRFRRDQVNAMTEIAAVEGVAVSALIRRAVDREISRVRRVGAKQVRAA